MNSLSSAILFTFLHSLWQSMFIVGYYHFDNFLFKNQSPGIKTNKLLLLLAIQLLISFTTFFSFYNNDFSIVNALITPINLITVNTLFETIAPYLTVAYFIILILKSAYTFVSWAKLKTMLMSELIKADVDVKLFTLHKSLELGIKKKINIWYSSKISSPITFGYFKPIILLPLSLMSKLSVAETEALILHELSHIKHQDFLNNWFLLFNEHVFFFNPFIKRLCNQIRWERELRCDLQVLNYSYNEIIYAESLYKAAVPGTYISNLLLNAVSNRFSLLKRIEFFTSHQNVNHKPGKIQQLSFAFSLIGLLILLNFNLFTTLNLKKEKIDSVYSAVTKVKNVKPLAPVNSAVHSAPILKVSSYEKAKVNSSRNFKIEHRKLPVTHNSDQNDININLSKSNESVSFISNTSENYSNQKQVIVKEENQVTGEVITKSYQLVKHNGIWESTILWVITEKPAVNPIKENKSGTIHTVQ
jgi:beta-lactamase regulating signal transducer with metallopeptidase domain